MSDASPDVPSPCINVCHMHAQTGWCEGCARSIDEIIIWGRADPATKRAVLAELPARRQRLEELGVWIPTDIP